ncbi:F-box protein CPR1-like [Impatiens glandulifera]|uniref:F-box protein CPR1-like n=1 Tax=Impatiens glandulifera TaxID=253017 RepID=UPI001FB1410F|nr:F-box protein CPR1-like [Impatiens glandulifera]
MQDDNLYRDFDSVKDAFLQLVEADKHPLKCSDYDIALCGSCDGLICLQNINGIVVIWNPSTRKSILLPYPKIKIANLSTDRKCGSYRFGYDNINDDYKVVRIIVLLDVKGDVIDYEVIVYSLKSNSWNRYEKFLHYPDMYKTGNSIVHGALHWISAVESDSEKESYIVAFDLRIEKYRVIQHPDYRAYGFDYDNMNGDDKVMILVVILDVRGDLVNHEVKVYSLKSNLWHGPMLECIENSIVDGAMQRISLHESLIVAFDFVTDK